ncbi:putative pyrroloquinoline-quinone binding quinoprotein [Micromonospora sp. M71_S20]|uniref:outer membrane protein assembly factor BamB family protein n=1 Tax=Micromonospora sp. M71_S20 TaxID=592872 RepID=UPI000F17A283|nr:PQQ-binding-like beta-propeller repeat protein [Micromonospora sp. M71_S20]RLK22791.1 putative pyrroloquinoline-quinone binding quinoprotein [Micromonospora sp. M71_S20]
MTVIDLGELRDEPGWEEAPPPRAPRAVGRPLRVALALALVVATVAGAAPAPQRDTLVVPAGAGAEAFLHGDRLYVVDRAEGETAGTAEVLAYALPGRPPVAGRPLAPLWRALLATTARIWQARSGPGVVLFGVVGDQDSGETVALDAATGGVRWRQPGHAWWEPGGALLLQTVGDNGGTVRSVDPASGRALWSTRTPREGALYDLRNGLVDRIAVIAERGRVEVRDARSGELLHARDLGMGELSGRAQLAVAHGLLLVGQVKRGLMTAYGLDGLRQRWETSLPAVAHVEDCGAVICVNRENGGFSVLDPATGAVRWTGGQWAGVLDERDGRLLAIEPGPLGQRFVLLDAATGRVVAELGTWQLIWGQDKDRPLVVRPAAAGSGLTVAELDAAAGEARVLDVLRDAMADCRRGADAVVCRLRAGGFGVWHYPG